MLRCSKVDFEEVDFSCGNPSKTQQVVGFDCAGIERLSVPQPNSCLLLGEPICSSALSGSSWADTPSYRNVLYPAGPCSYVFETNPAMYREAPGGVSCTARDPARITHVTPRVLRTSPRAYYYITLGFFGLNIRD